MASFRLQASWACRPTNQKVNKADEQTYFYISIRLGSGHHDIQHKKPQHNSKKVVPSVQ
jgi:hypothetical protein